MKILGRRKFADGRRKTTIMIDITDSKALDILKNNFNFESKSQVVNALLTIWSADELFTRLIKKFPNRAFELSPKQIQQYERENKVEPSGTYKAIYIKKPISGRVVVE